MIITISGKAGSGKTEIGKKLAKKLNYKFISMGDLRGKIALKHNLTIDQLNEIGKREDWTDKQVDEQLIKIGKKDNYVIDTWIGFHFIPNSIKIFLEVNPKIGAERIFKDQRSDEEKKQTVEQIMEMLEKRRENTRLRYKKYYNVDFLNKPHYDFILDTTNLTKREVFDKLYNFIKTKL